MEIYDETKEGLKNLWEDSVLRQQAKIVITQAIGNATSLTVKEAQDIMEELDVMLKPEEEDNKKKATPGL